MHVQHRTELGMIQPALMKQKAVLKRKSGHDRQVMIRSPDPTESERRAEILLLQEAIIMGQIRHPNVVQLHGLIIEDNKVLFLIHQKHYIMNQNPHR